MKKTVLLFSSFALVLQASGQVAFVNPVGLPSAGLQTDGPYNMGLEFTVNRPIQITQLGVYDSTIGGSDTGFGSIVQVSIYSEATSSFITPAVSFLGTVGTEIDGSRFQAISTLTLNPGIYMVVAGGIGISTAPDWNTYTAGDTLTTPLTFDGGEDNTLTDGQSYYSVGSPGTVSPATTLDPGAAPHYAAGTFIYTPVPEPTTTALAISGLALFGAIQYMRRSRVN